MFTTSNALTLLRAPIALLFLINRVDVRIVLLCVAVLTDCVDGYLARRYKHVTKVGAVLDPLMDKFFVLFVLGIFYVENKIGPWQAVSMLSRDFAILIFSIYLLSTGLWKNYTVKAGIWGKITTAFQFMIIFCLAMNFSLNAIPFYLFITFGLLVLCELFLTLKTNVEKV